MDNVENYFLDYSSVSLEKYLSRDRIMPLLLNYGCYYHRCKFCSHYYHYGNYMPMNVKKIFKMVKEMYNNITTLNASIDLFAKTRLEGKYAYEVYSHGISYIDMKTGESDFDRYSNRYPTRCVNTLANIKTSSLKVGELLYDNGVPVGKIFSLNPNVVIALSSSTTDYQGAQNYCKNMTAGGLNWTLPDGILLEKINATKTYIDGCTHYWSSTRSCFLCGNNSGDCRSGTSPDTAIALCIAYF